MQSSAQVDFWTNGDRRHSWAQPEHRDDAKTMPTLAIGDRIERLVWRRRRAFSLDIGENREQKVKSCQIVKLQSAGVRDACAVTIYR